MARLANVEAFSTSETSALSPTMRSPSRIGRRQRKSVPAYMAWMPGRPPTYPDTMRSMAKRMVGGATPCLTQNGLRSPIPWAQWRIASRVATSMYGSGGGPGRAGEGGAGEFQAKAVEYPGVNATGRTEKEALVRLLDALELHLKQAGKETPP